MNINLIMRLLFRNFLALEGTSKCFAITIWGCVWNEKAIWVVTHSFDSRCLDVEPISYQFDGCNISNSHQLHGLGSAICNFRREVTENRSDISNVRYDMIKILINIDWLTGWTFVVAGVELFIEISKTNPSLCTHLCVIKLYFSLYQPNACTKTKQKKKKQKNGNFYLNGFGIFQTNSHPIHFGSGHVNETMLACKIISFRMFQRITFMHELTWQNPI